MNSENVDMLMEIISEDPIFKYNSKHNPRLKDECLNSLRIFYEKEKLIDQDLMTFNKKYLSFMLNKMTKNETPYTQYIEKVETLEPYHSKDIIAERQNNYEKQFQLKKEEFDNAITLKPPPMPQFADKKDIPIGDMDRELKQIMEKRNLDILPERKQIKIANEDILIEKNVVDLNKKLTWADESIFSKLKKIGPIQKTIQDTITEPTAKQISLQEQINNINIKLDLILSKL